MNLMSHMLVSPTLDNLICLQTSLALQPNLITPGNQHRVTLKMLLGRERGGGGVLVMTRIYIRGQLRLLQNNKHNNGSIQAQLITSKNSFEAQNLNFIRECSELCLTMQGLTCLIKTAQKQPAQFNSIQSFISQNIRYLHKCTQVGK